MFFETDKKTQIQKQSTFRLMIPSNEDTEHDLSDHESENHESDSFSDNSSSSSEETPSNNV